MDTWSVHVHVGACKHMFIYVYICICICADAYSYESQAGNGKDVAWEVHSSVSLQDVERRQKFPSAWVYPSGTHFPGASLKALADFARYRWRTINSVFMSTKALLCAPQAHILVSPLSVLPICHVGSVPLTAAGHLPVEGPQHMAGVITQAAG